MLILYGHNLWEKSHVCVSDSDILARYSTNRSSASILGTLLSLYVLSSQNLVFPKSVKKSIKNYKPPVVIHYVSFMHHCIINKPLKSEVVYVATQQIKCKIDALSLSQCEYMNTCACVCKCVCVCVCVHACMPTCAHAKLTALFLKKQNVLSVSCKFPDKLQLLCTTGNLHSSSHQ